MSHKRLEDTIGYSFNNKEILQRALTHRSFNNENTGCKCNNEQLEFLGDTVLALCISEMLISMVPEAKEGTLSKLRASIVDESTLASVARTIGLGEFLYLSRGEERNGGRDRNSILADAVEALIAAIYMDCGYLGSKKFISTFFTSIAAQAIAGQKHSDYKTALQELLQSRKKPLPIYVLTGTSGAEHAPIFVIDAEIDGIVLGRGRGRSKKEAEQEAARVAYGILAEQQREGAALHADTG